MNNNATYPLKDILEPHDHDVLCGRGGGTNNHIGNSHWRMLVAANKQLYITLPKRQKMLLSRSIVNAVRSQNPPGRFLQKDAKTKLWFDVGDQRAQEKTSQALREGAPDIRKKVAAATATATVKSINAQLAANNSGGSNSNSRDTVERVPSPPQIPGHPSQPQTQPRRTSESSSSSQSGNTGGMVSVPSQQEQLRQQFQQQQQQQQQQFPIGNNNLYDGIGSNNINGNGNSSQLQNFMTLNERGLMVQNAMMMANSRGMNMNVNMNMNMNTNMNMGVNNGMNNIHSYHLQQQQQQQQQQFYQYNQFQHQQNNYQQQQPQPQPQHYPSQQQYYNHQSGPHENNNNNSNHTDPLKTTPDFDELVAAPLEDLEPQGISFGSMAMSDNEMQRLQQSTAPRQGSNDQRFSQLLRQLAASKPGSGSGSKSNSNNPVANETKSQKHDGPVPAAPMGGILEPTGISIGDISMASASTNLTNFPMSTTGTSFGTVLSYNMLNNSNPDMVDGGLMDAVGTSFGSLSLERNRVNLYKTLEIAAGGPEVPPMFQSEIKSSANLLDCSDTESETSQDKEQLTKQKSQAWEMMKTQLEQQNSRGNHSAGSKDLMPPPPVGKEQNGNADGHRPHEFDSIEIALPPTTMEANFSTLSAWSAADEGFDGDVDDDVPAVVSKLVGRNSNSNSNGNGNDDDDDDDADSVVPPPALAKTDSF